MSFAVRGKLAMLLGVLRLAPRDRRAVFGAAVLAILGVSAFIALLDGWLLRSRPPASYVDFYTGPLVPRTFVMCLLSAWEEVLYRLLLMTALVVLASAARVRLTWPVVLAIILLAQLVAVHALVVADPLYASLRTGRWAAFGAGSVGGTAG